MSIRTRLRSLEDLYGDRQERHEAEQEARDFQRYENDPAGFGRDELGLDLWSRQLDIASAVVEHPLVRVQSANSIGKDFTACAVLAPWWVYCRRGYVLLTGPSDRQVREICMKLVSGSFRRGRLPGDLYTYAIRLEDDHAGLLAFVSNDVSKITGFHAPKILTICTEAQGVEDFQLEGLLANMAGEHDRFLALGNPTTLSGWFHQTSKSKDWHSITISAFEHPNVVEGRTVIPGAVTSAQVHRIRSTYGEDSPVYAARVLGEYPTQSLHGLYSATDIDAAVARYAEWLEEHADAPPVLSCDPARFGADSTAVATRRGPCIVSVETRRKQSTTETARQVEELAEGLGMRPGSRQRGGIICDVVGLGAGVVDTLVDGRWQVAAFNAGGEARDSGRFVNRRTECAWLLRDDLEAGAVALPPDEELREEMLAVEWTVTADGRVALEAKDAMRAKLGRSPDKYDAVMQTYAIRSVPKPLAPPQGTSRHSWPAAAGGRY